MNDIAKRLGLLKFIQRDDGKFLIMCRCYDPRRGNGQGKGSRSQAVVDSIPEAKDWIADHDHRFLTPAECLAERRRLSRGG